jgi:nucleotide-binding universal stress UspA family protein
MNAKVRNNGQNQTFVGQKLLIDIVHLNALTMDFKKILIAVDNSICSEKAAKVGYEMAKKFNSEVALLNIIVPAPQTVNPDFALAPVFLEIYDNSEENSHLLLKEIEQKYGNGIATSYLTTLDTATHGITHQAKEWNADLIVIGTHGRTGLYHFFVGSVAENVAGRATCPVLIIPNKD